MPAHSVCSVDDASLALAAIELLLPHALLDPACAEVGSKMPSHNPSSLLQMAVRLRLNCSTRLVCTVRRAKMTGLGNNYSSLWVVNRRVEPCSYWSRWARKSRLCS